MLDQGSRHKNQVAEHFGRAARNWDGVYGSQRSVNAARIQERQRRILQYVDRLGLPPGSRVLDLGCGAGRASVELLRRGFTVEGVDISQEMIDLARANSEQAGFTGGFNFRVGDAEHLPFADNSFDLVVSIGMLGVGPVSWGQSVVAELQRLVKPGGHVALTYPNRLSIGHAFSQLDVPVSLRRFLRRLTGRSLQREQPTWVMDRTKYTPGRFNRILRQSGFRTLDEVSLGFAPIQILGRNLFTRRGSVRFDRFMHGLAERPGATFLQRMGRTYLTLAQKTPAPADRRQ